MKVFVTGGTGFVGNEVIKQLLAAEHEVRALIRVGSEQKLKLRDQVETHHGDVTDAASLDGALASCDAVIHLVGIIREFPDKEITFQRLHVAATRNLLKAAEEQDVKRFLQMSSNGARPNGEAKYHITKWQAEEAVRASGLDWTIFRPSLIFGPGGEFVKMLSDLIRKMPVMPVIGNGRYRMQPVAVEQVAESFVKALDLPATIGQGYQLGGAEDYPYDEILDLTGAALGKESLSKAHQPLFMVKPMVKVMEHMASFPITSEQLIMLLEGNVCDPAEWAETFNIDPLSYEDGIEDCFDHR